MKIYLNECLKTTNNNKKSRDKFFSSHYYMKKNVSQNCASRKKTMKTGHIVVWLVHSTTQAKERQFFL